MDIGKKRMIYIGAAALVALLIVWALIRESPMTVETDVSKRERMTVTIDGEGKTRIRDKHTITAPISGRMSRVKLVEGDNIPRDYPVTEIDPNPPMPRTPLPAGNYPNPYATKVFAPAAGKVLRIFEKSETLIAAGTPILEIGDPNNLEIVADILSTDAVRIPPGAPILIENGDPQEPIRARVKMVESQAITKVSALGVEEQRVNVIGEFLSKNVRFGDNFRIDVRIVVWEADGVLTIPSSAIFRSGDNWNVFVVESGRARRQEVKVGHQNGNSAEILDGLKEGKTVVLHPANQLADGASVSTR